jgi:hypothetical protein
MNPIIEKVALAILDSGEGCLSGAAYVDPHKSARAAIRATLEGLRDNVSERVISEGESAASIGIGKPSDDEAMPRVWKAMINQAIAELDA